MFRKFLFNQTGDPSRSENGQAASSSEPSWIFTTIARGISTLAGLIAILLGGWSFLLLEFIAGPMLIMEGLIITLIESPCLFVFLNFADVPSRFFDNKPHWWRAVTYLVFSILPFFSSKSLSVVFACCLMVAASGSYLVLSLGKKASLEEMRAKATLSENPNAILVNNEASIDRSGPAVFTPPVVLGDMKQSLPLPSQNSVITY